ncbi:MAG: alpha-ketoglutarate-dependent dioxygenase AlkB [Kangiellaceae bacterium]
MTDLFSQNRPTKEEIYPDVFVLANFINTKPLLDKIKSLTKIAPFNKMMTPNGHNTNIPFTNCGEFGWTSDLSGYRYSRINPITKQSWPLMPKTFFTLAQDAAKNAGFENFTPDACLINQYSIGSKLGAHQDKNEKDFTQPIVSVSIGLPAVFQIFGNTRSGVEVSYHLQDGDVMVWGKSARLIYHGVKTISVDPLNSHSTHRFNITFRKSN